MNAAWLIGIALATAAGTAAADPRADAISRHADADVAELRAQLPGDANVRCTLGAVYAARGDLSRASLYLEPCSDAQLADDLAQPIARARREVRAKLATSELSGIDVLTDPEGVWAEVDALPGDRFQTPQMIWVPAGHHVVTATSATGAAFTNAIDTRPHARGPLMISLAAPPPTQVRAGREDLSDDSAGDTETGPPPAVPHGSIMPQHYIDGGTAAGPHIDDPLEHVAPPSRGRGARFGVRFGGGVFDHSGADARLGFDAGAVMALPLAPRLACAARVDWSRRGGASMATNGVDALGATAGLGITLARLSALDVVAGGGARVAIATGDTMDASRATLAGAAWLELPLHATPLTLGARFEQGITEFAPGARDRAAVAEVGVDFP